MFVLEIDTSGWGDVIEPHAGSGDGGHPKGGERKNQEPTRTMETSSHD